MSLHSETLSKKQTDRKFSLRNNLFGFVLALWVVAFLGFRSSDPFSFPGPVKIVSDSRQLRHGGLVGQEAVCVGRRAWEIVSEPNTISM